MTADAFRELALSLPATLEAAHMGHPDFRTNGRIFATLDASGAWGVVMLTPDEQQALVAEDRETYVPAAGAWGRQGTTRIRLASAPRAAVRGAIQLAWQHAADTPPTRPRSRTRAGSPRPKPPRRQ